MLFNSAAFLFFFPVVTLLFYLLPHRFRWLLLLLASFVFYMAFLPVYVLILAVTILIDYIAGIYIERASGAQRKRYLLWSIIANIGFLALFKYYDFFVINFNSFSGLHLPVLAELCFSKSVVWASNAVNTAANTQFGTQFNILTQLILPVGLSFHTFQAMSYTIEVYRGAQKAERHLGIYALYVMFYPQMVAGPIERPQNILPQLWERKSFSSENLIVGLRLMAWGFFKKVVIADRLALYVNAVYENPESFHWGNLVIATLFFTIQIYCDFSGYSDIAIGAARTMGFKLMINFRRPYFAQNIKVFWDRWHISLTTWFRDYVYIPLGGNRVPFGRLLLNIAIVFLLSGFWHGANWNFLLWGVLHASYLLIYTLWSRAFAGKNSLQTPHSIVGRFAGWLLTFVCVALAWIYFRASSVAEAHHIISGIAGLETPQTFHFLMATNTVDMEKEFYSLAVATLGVAAIVMVESQLKPMLSEMNERPILDLVFLVVVALGVLFFGLFNSESFIYFQF